MRRILTVAASLAAVAALATAFAVPALAVDGPVKTYAQSLTLGYYRGQVVSYLDLGPVKLAKGNKVEPIWAFTNGADGQANVIDTVPGQKNYTPLWGVRLVTWKNGVTPRVLKSAAAVKKAMAAGQVTMSTPGVVVNCPVL
jgi:hypothetical protein